MLQNLFFNQIQITFLYFLMFFDLFQNTLKNLYLINTPLKILIPYLFIFEKLFKLKFLYIFFNSNNIFIIIYLLVKIFVINPIFKLSKIVKYNLLFILILISIQRIINLYYDTFLSNDIILKNNFLFRKTFNLNNNFKNLLILNNFLIFFFLYLYLYITAIFNKYPKISFLTPLTDSIAFWLRFKTPTIKYGKF